MHFGAGVQVAAEAVTLGSTLDLPRDLLFDTLAKNAVVAPAQYRKAGWRQKARPRAAIPMHKDFGLVLASANWRGAFDAFTA